MGEPVIRSLSFLTPGNFPDDDPYAGLEDTLRLFELGERAGFDGAWIRQRHLEHGVSAAAVFLAAASQRTSRIELGTAVIPMGYESPFRLGEDLNLLTGNIVFGEGATDFVAAQRAYISEYRRLAGADRPARVALGRVVVPFDGADSATRKRYRAYEQSRHERTLAPQGERGVLFAPDLVGPAAQIVEQLHADAAVQQVSEFRIELPYEFNRDDYEQILHDVVHAVAPELGWKPGGGNGQVQSESG